MTTITRERLLKIQQWRETYGPGSNVVLPAEEAEELARIALASLTAEPVAWIVHSRGGDQLTTDANYVANAEGMGGIHSTPVYAAPPAPTVTFYRDGIESAAAWVNKQREEYDNEHGRHDPDTGTFEFGNDAQRDYSATLEEIAEGIRSLHPNTAPPAPVVPVEMRNRFRAEGLAELLKDARDYAPLTAEQWETLTNNWHQTFVGLSGEGDACRAAMLDNCATVESRNHAGCSPKNVLKCADARQGSQPVSNRDELPPGIKPAPELDSEDINAKSLPRNPPSKCSLRDGIEAIRNSGIPVDVDKIQSECEAGNSPVIPDGYALVPIVPTEDMVINGFESEPDPHFSDEKEWAKYEALSGCRRAAHRAKLCWAAMIAARPKLKHDLT
ncbi:TPA: hypothetical protein ACQJX9_005296 [Citrobacter farmeri]